MQDIEDVSALVAFLGNPLVTLGPSSGKASANPGLTQQKKESISLARHRLR